MLVDLLQRLSGVLSSKGYEPRLTLCVPGNQIARECLIAHSGGPHAHIRACIIASKLSSTCIYMHTRTLLLSHGFNPARQRPHCE